MEFAGGSVTFMQNMDEVPSSSMLTHSLIRRCKLDHVLNERDFFFNGYDFLVLPSMGWYNLDLGLLLMVCTRLTILGAHYGVVADPLPNSYPQISLSE